MKRTGFKRYKIKAGKQQATPLDGLGGFRIKGDQIAFIVVFEPSCYFPISEWQYGIDNQVDSDYFDWAIKTGMVTSIGLNPNRNTHGLVGRPDPLQFNVMQLTAYTNDQNKDWSWGPEFMRTPVWEKAYLSATLLDESVEWIMSDSDEVYSGVHPWKRPKRFRWTGTWFGGQDNSKGPYGGRTTQDMVFWVKRCKQ